MNTKNAFSTLLTVLITAVAVGVLTGMIMGSKKDYEKRLAVDSIRSELSNLKANQSEKEKNSTTQANLEKQRREEELKNEKEVAAMLRDKEYHLEFNGEHNDYRIVKKTNLLESVKKAANLTDFTLTEFAFPKNPTKIFLKETLLDSDNSSGAIWSFDVNSKELKKLVNVNVVFDGFGGVAVSPDKLLVVHAPNEDSSKTLKLLDLNNDAVKTLVTLPENESLNAGYGFLSNKFNIKWLDNLTIQYDVYDQSKANKELQQQDKPLIETRTIKIK